ncbi:MAG: hypothetical protein HY240_10400 [Actinobacteria bacterium]|nr:hypothetical protein [Actinomycetota bacterium]
MRSWWLPSAAAAFWAGLLAWSIAAGSVSAWAPAVVALAAFAAAIWASPRSMGSGRRGLELAHLAVP